MDRREVFVIWPWESDGCFVVRLMRFEFQFKVFPKGFKMARVSEFDRARVFARDGWRCAACGAFEGLTIQHRQALGMGGSKRRRELFELLTACATCNARFESDLQSEALRLGWKVRRNIGDVSLADVPVQFFAHGWCLIGGQVRQPISSEEAAAKMALVTA